MKSQQTLGLNLSLVYDTYVSYYGKVPGTD